MSILGNGSAVPTAFQNPSSQLIKYHNLRFLIDCGEGTQMQFIKFNFSYRNLSHIFISHLHGDHFLGLTGLISTFHLYGRSVPLHIFAPSPLEAVILQQLSVSGTRLQFELKFHALQDNEILYDDPHLQVSCFPLHHSIPTWGFVFREKEETERKLDKVFVNDYLPGIEQMQQIKLGADFNVSDGSILKNKDITIDPLPARSYAYCSDTLYDEEIIPFVGEVDLLYHEATFDNATQDKAAEKLHATAAQAATIAKIARVNKLLLGHFSARFSDTLHLLNEAQEIFPNTLLSQQGETYAV